VKSITIHGLDKKLDEIIRKKAKNSGLSINRTIKKLLKESLGMKGEKENMHKANFIDIFGSWTKEDEKEFLKAVQDFEEIDKEEWQ